MFALIRSSCLHTVSLFLLIVAAMPALAQNGGAGSQPAATEQAQETAAPAQNPRSPIHIVPYGERATSPKAQSKPGGRLSNNGQVQYWGGPVISQVNVVVVHWGNFVNTGLGNMPQFFTDITTTDYFDVLAEFSTVGLTGFGGLGGTNQTIDNVVSPVSPVFIINPVLCPGSALGTACSLTDAQIQTEIIRQLNIPGALPTPMQDGQGNFNTIYMIYFPPGVTINLAQGVNSCQRGGFCAYHNNVFPGSPQVPYGVFPDFSSGGCAPRQGCGIGSVFDNLTAASSHELGEAVTDVDVGSAQSFAPPLAWADQNTGEEIGDFCNQNTASVTVNGTVYNVQKLFSNMQNACVAAPASFQISASTTNAVPGTPFQVTVSGEGIFGLLTNYNDAVHFTSSDGAASLPADFTFVPGVDNGSHTFTVTMNSIGSQTVTVNDTLIKRMTGVSPSVDIEHNPDLTVNMSHSVSFKQGDTGDTYTIVVTNSGDMPTTGAQVTTQLIVPFGLTPTALGGTGWTCNVGALQCTRADAVAARTPYPAINLTVNVAFNAGATLTPSAQVSGGGELNTSNDQASDPTTIIQFPDLVLQITQNGPFTQGLINAQYLLTVQNVNSVASSGTVTVTDTLPSGLTATAIGGTGWSCSAPPTLSCTRSDALAGGAFYPAITLTMNVDPAAPSPVTDNALVAGGGEVNTGNDSASIVTTISPPTPDVAISASHSANLTQGENGATYTLIVSNVGSAATNQAVTVNDSLSLIATAISGSGWSCTLGSLSCSRSDSLPPFTGGTPPAYPPVTITFNIAPNAPAQQSNLANVSGGGEINLGNDSQFDPLNIIQLPNLTVNQSLTSQLAQGLMGASYSINVSNNSTGVTSGTVTATGQLSAGLTATAITGNGWNCTLSNLTCTRSDSLGAFSSYPSISVTFNVAANAPSSVSFTATVSGGGEIITSDDTQTLTEPVQPPVALTPVSSTASVVAGGVANYTVNVFAVLPGSMQAACSSGLPAGAKCNIFPATFTGPFNGPISVSISTTGAFGSVFSGPRRRQLPLYAALIPGIGLMLMVAGRRRRRARLALIGVAGLTLLFAGCGGGGSSVPPITPTPPGTYTVTLTVTNTTANTQSSTPLTLTVQ